MGEAHKTEKLAERGAKYVRFPVLAEVANLQGVSFIPGVFRVLDGKKESDRHAVIPTMEIAKIF